MGSGIAKLRQPTRTQEGRSKLNGTIVRLWPSPIETMLANHTRRAVGGQSWGQHFRIPPPW